MKVIIKLILTLIMVGVISTLLLERNSQYSKDANFNMIIYKFNKITNKNKHNCFSFAIRQNSLNLMLKNE